MFLQKAVNLLTTELSISEKQSCWLELTLYVYHLIYNLKNSGRTKPKGKNTHTAARSFQQLVI